MSDHPWRGDWEDDGWETNDHTSALSIDPYFQPTRGYRGRMLRYHATRRTARRYINPLYLDD
jgi:hypothetical protein